jgi:hypothetical protein
MLKFQIGVDKVNRNAMERRILEVVASTHHPGGQVEVQ